MVRYAKNTCRVLGSALFFMIVLSSVFVRVALAAPYHMNIGFTTNLDLTDNGVLLFNESNVASGDEFVTPLSVQNNSGINDVHFGIRSISVDNLDFVSVMRYQVFDSSGNLVYDTDTPFEQELAVFANGDLANFTIKTIIKPETGNIIQNQSANFQFVFYVYTFEDAPEDPNVPNTGAQRIIDFFVSEENYILITPIVGLVFLVFFAYKRRNRKEGAK